MLAHLRICAMMGLRVESSVVQSLTMSLLEHQTEYEAKVLFINLRFLCHTINLIHHASRRARHHEQFRRQDPSLGEQARRKDLFGDRIQ